MMDNMNIIHHFTMNHYFLFQGCKFEISYFYFDKNSLQPVFV